MNGPSDPRLVQRLSVFASSAAGFAVVAGLAALAGWKYHLSALDTWVAAPVRIVPNAAACLVLLGVSLGLQKRGDNRSFASIWITKFTAKAAAVIVCLVGLLSLAEHVFGWDLGIDRLLVVVSPAEAIAGVRPGLMAMIAALNFLVLGSALLLLDWKTRHGHWPAQFLSFAAAIGAIFGLFALVLQPRASGITMALPATATFFILACGLVCSRANWAIGGLLTNPNAGARLLRSVIPAALLVLGLVGWSVSKALLTEAHITWVEASLLAILCGALLVGFVTWIAFIVDRSDALNARLEQRVAERTVALQSEVSERTLAEEALRESEKRFQDMANGIPQLAWMAEADGSIFWYNQRWYEYTGTTLEQMQGWAWQSVHDPAVLPSVLEGWKGAITAGKPFDMEFPLRGADGCFRMFLTRVMPVKDSAGLVMRWFGTNTDISERKQTEERQAAQVEELARQAEELARSRFALEAQTQTLQSVLGSMGEGLIAIDKQGRFLLWNAAAEKMLGKAEASLATEEWPERFGLYLPDTVTPFPVAQLPVVRALNGEASASEMFVRNRALPEGAWIEVSGGPRTDNDGVTCGGVVALRNITQRKADERKIRELNDELEHRVGERTAQLEAANKELEAFSYSVSHDLRAPLRHISGFSQMLVEEFGSTLDPIAQRYLSRIQVGTQKMGLLVDELLRLARVGRHALRRQPTSLNAMVAEVIVMLEPESAGRQVEWVIADLPAVECDPVLVKQIFQNLLANALKFTRPRARAVIEVRYQQKADEQPVFVVRDNGIGFDMKYVDKLFGVFQRLHRAEEFEGTGIGLATVQRIVQKHGGRAWAEGKPDQGAAFYFTLGVNQQAESKSNGATAGGQ